MIAPAGDSEEAVAARMQEVRRRGHSNAYQLRVDVDRVSDWREHVKAHPLPAVVAAALLGYVATSKMLGGKSDNRVTPRVEIHHGGSSTTTEKQVAKASIGAGVAAFAGSIVSNMLRQYAKGYVDNYIRNLTHKD